MLEAELVGHFEQQVEVHQVDQRHWVEQLQIGALELRLGMVVLQQLQVLQPVDYPLGGSGRRSG